jgi:phosphatidylserine decarboxylase
LGAALCFLVSRISWFSALYGKIQKLPCSKRKVAPFITKFHIKAKEFEKSIDEFTSFNDFFIRKLHSEARPIADTTAVLPADARYTIIPEISKAEFLVKGRAFHLKDFLQDEDLAKKYEDGSMVIARLCPLDYHRFHFPCDGIAGKPKPINGYLYSVNPIALYHNWKLLSENRRVLTLLETKEFGTVAMVEVGATCVGEIFQTYMPGQQVHRGDEKGYFSFGGSAMVLLFEKNKIQFSEDLLKAPLGMEIVGKMGQRLGNP